jgi:chromosome segregation ATPase
MFCFKFQSGTYFIPVIICLLFNSCVSLEKYEAQQNHLEHTKKTLHDARDENDILNSDKAELMRKNITINEQLIEKERSLTFQLDSLRKQYQLIKAKNDDLEQLANGTKNDAIVFQQMLGEMSKKFDDFQIKNTEQTKTIQRDIRKIQAETRKISDKLESANTSPQ